MLNITGSDAVSGMHVYGWSLVRSVELGVVEFSGRQFGEADCGEFLNHEAVQRLTVDVICAHAADGLGLSFGAHERGRMGDDGQKFGLEELSVSHQST